MSFRKMSLRQRDQIFYWFREWLYDYIKASPPAKLRFRAFYNHEVNVGGSYTYIQRYVYHKFKAKSKLRCWNVAEYQLNKQYIVKPFYTSAAASTRYVNWKSSLDSDISRAECHA